MSHARREGAVAFIFLLFVFCSRAPPLEIGARSLTLRDLNI
jgi:hypothetical protein